jgi:hypothetical protein
MVYKDLRQLLSQLYQRRAELENLICFFERYGKQAARRRNRSKRLLRLMAQPAAAQN